MDVLDEILKENENSNIGIYKNIIDEFTSQTNVEFSFDIYDLYSNKYETFLSNYLYNPKYSTLIFSILLRHNYNMKKEIITVMFELCYLDNPDSNKETISKYLHSPIIDDVSYDGEGTYTIFSEQYGIFTFTLASFYYRNDKIIKDYLEKEHLLHRCHEHTYFMAKILGGAYAVTALCLNFFYNSYYHSYTVDIYDDIVIDWSHNFVINKDSYYKLFDPKEISIILNRKVNNELQIVEDKTMQPIDRCHLLKIALYKQYLKSINYRGSLEDAPTLKK